MSYIFETAKKDQMQEKIDEQDKEIQRLKTLLSQNGIDERKTEK